MKLIIVNDVRSNSWFSPIEDEVIPTISAKIMGQHMVLRNITLLNTIFKIRFIEIPPELCSLKNLILQYFPSTNVSIAKTRHVLEKSSNRNSSSQIGSHATESLTALVNSESSTMTIPFNSILHLNKDGNIVVDEILYPWDFLKSVQEILEMEINSSLISPKAKISKTSIIEGPCIIEDGVVIDDFCKIKGPVYIGRDSFIGMGSLVRNSILEQNTRIGFNCEIGKSYFSGNDKISHHNVILDSIVGHNVWFGGYSGTANVLLDRRNVRYKVNNTVVDTGTDHFGSVIGDNCCIGASVIILPGRKVLPNSHIQAGTIIKY